MRRLLLLFVVAALVGAGCAGDDDGAAGERERDETAPTTTRPVVEGGRMVVALETEPDGLDPTESLFGVSGLTAALAVFDPLLVIDEHGDVVPYLAESYSGNAESTRWIIALRPGVTFSDGTALDAGAVVASVDRVLASPLLRSALRDVRGVRVVDTLTVEIETEPAPGLPALLTGQLGLVRSPSMTSAREPVGTGPFVLEEWSHGDRLTFRRNDSYWREGLPHLDELELRPIPSLDERVAAFDDGAVDVITRAADAGVGERATVLVLNPDRAPFDDDECAAALTADACGRDSFVLRTSLPSSATDTLVDEWDDDGLLVTVERLDRGRVAVADLLGDFDAILRVDDGLLQVQRRAEGDVVERVVATSGWEIDLGADVGGSPLAAPLPSGEGTTTPIPGVVVPVALARARPTTP